MYKHSTDWRRFMSNDSEDRRSDFAKWAEEMSYEEEKEYKKQKKREEKELKKQQKLERKNAKKADAEASEEEAVTEEAVSSEETEAAEATAIAEATETSEATEESEEDEQSEEDYEDYNPDYKKVKKKKSSKDSKEVNIVRELLNLIIYIGIVIILCYCIITFVGQRTTVSGMSMSPTLESGDNLWIDKFSYRVGDPKRFDIVVFPYQDSDVFYIKRVIGLPGETVQIAPDGSIIIDGQILQESYGKEVIRDSGTACDPITLGEDEYFVLGDNRNDSRDSRWPDVGNIHKDKIVGKAVFRLTPFSKFGRVK